MKIDWMKHMRIVVITARKEYLFLLFTLAFTSVRWMYARRNWKRSETTIVSLKYSCARRELGSLVTKFSLELSCAALERKVLSSPEGSWASWMIFAISRSERKEIFSDALNKRLPERILSFDCVRLLCGVNNSSVTTCIVLTIPRNRSKWPNSSREHTLLMKVIFMLIKNVLCFPSFRFQCYKFISVSIFPFVPSITWRHNNLSETFEKCFHIER